MSTAHRRAITHEDLAFAYELREMGFSWKRISQAIGYTPKWLQNAVYRAKRWGIHR